MKYDPDKHHRRSVRLKEYDYSQSGAYFVTICTQNRTVLFDRDETKSIIQKWWDALPSKFTNIRCDQFVIMPNHIHGIIIINDQNGVSVRAIQCDCPTNVQTHWSAPTLGTIIQWFKTMTTNEFIMNIKSNKLEPFDKRLWQRNYYERVIRNESELNAIRQYIIDNPINWENDENNPRLLHEAYGI